MRRLLDTSLLSLVILVGLEARAQCHHYVQYTYVETVYGDGTRSGTWVYDGSYSVCSYGGGGSTYTSGPTRPGGGGTGGTPLSITTLQNEYEEAGCDVPPASAFESEYGYSQHPSDNYTFAQLSGGNRYAIITDELKFGLDQMVNMLDGRVPVLTSAYRTPTQNSGTTGSASCSAHTRGTAADISIRDANGNLSCTMWNMYVEAADGWVESWDEMISRGGTPHFHVDFGRAKNDPGTCRGYP